MKKIRVLLSLTLLSLMYSCEKEAFARFGFDTLINGNSSGLVVIDISPDVEQIKLKGFIRLSEGEFEINLIDPNGTAVYSRSLAAPFEMEIDETFETQEGRYRLKYTSTNAVGEIDIHLTH